ncbi:MAG: hypothetical protein DMF84_18465 [Acidobacteria bacterium]|nr:MAG: hypothetical protein DMF84_18465 [Acidobacteriota bacterium]
MAPVRLSGPLGFFLIALAFVLGLSASREISVRADAQDVVRLVDGTAVNLATPSFLVKGRRYAFTWAGGGPPQTYSVKDIRSDGWILVEVADEITRPDLYIPGEFPLRWLHVGLAVSVQEMRPLP